MVFSSLSESESGLMGVAEPRPQSPQFLYPQDQIEEDDESIDPGTEQDRSRPHF